MTDTKQPPLGIIYAKQTMDSMKYIKKTDYAQQLNFKFVQLNLI